MSLARSDVSISRKVMDKSSRTHPGRIGSPAACARGQCCSPSVCARSSQYSMESSTVPRGGASKYASRPSLRKGVLRNIVVRNMLCCKELERPTAAAALRLLVPVPGPGARVLSLTLVAVASAGLQAAQSPFATDDIDHLCDPLFRPNLGAEVIGLVQLLVYCP